MKKRKCRKCNKSISYYSILCRCCYKNSNPWSGSKNPRYRILSKKIKIETDLGEIKYILRCIDCNKKLVYSSKQSAESSLKRKCKCNSCGNKGRISWNKGLTKESDKRILRQSKTISGNKSNLYGRTGQNNISVKRILDKFNISYDEYINSLPKRKYYYRVVLNITKRQPIHLLENYNKRGPSGKRNSYHLDHIYPISKGFENSIPPEIIGDITNLRFIHWKENVSKSNKLLIDI